MNKFEYKIIIVIAFLAILISSYSLWITNKKDINYVERNVYTSHIIKSEVEQTTDLWEIRYVVTVGIYDDNNLVSILITTSNGEDMVQDKDLIKRILKPVVDLSVRQFDWLDKYEISINVQ